MKNNQNNQIWGGGRKGAGRPKGSTKRPRISDYITRTEVKKLVNIAKRKAEEKPEILRFLLEQIFGKAGLNIEPYEEEEQPILHSEIALKTLAKIKEYNLRTANNLEAKM
ncbi:hypothetical protein A2344_00285 [Candidatus Peregrinibacteria bacterium RIFOXYB12_FULL_41_12]|nr:MAG: hypothetical protein A2244_01695 [Candidatus Peregrinibacteria bacterium RIFOXYA2_FULL_41_18]OGJ49455.1 MAG: hypothetical protein A2344_00285 [Candidatus Peregrinibacteria bacterium RIFOXYB12_FULL_41_12]OGJ53356.1 MAG: hypothetical protein A2448_01300 [Candidatus Peregrinibacteria bacterium RIFOXYC2_FULL_41_22]OGJ54355.1 MAG: hypothetical protein A2336_00170 [Candidatus Peregrinibacteria bacterium RIFOXYB2_FULL_41_88]